MNPLTNMRNVLKLSEQELDGRNRTSWHDQYRDSAWIFVGGLPYDLSEGDVICIFSQYGEIIHLNLVRDKDTGKSRGFCFICYEDQQSTDLAVDNFNGIKILSRIIRVDHVNNFKVPKSERDKVKQLQQQLPKAECEDKTDCKWNIQKVKLEVKQEVKNEPIDGRETLADQIVGDMRLPPRLPIYSGVKQEAKDKEDKKVEMRAKKLKKSKSKKSKSKKHKKEKRQRSISSCSSSDSD